MYPPYPLYPPYPTYPPYPPDPPLYIVNCFLCMFGYRKR